MQVDVQLLQIVAMEVCTARERIKATPGPPYLDLEEIRDSGAEFTTLNSSQAAPWVLSYLKNERKVSEDELPMLATTILALVGILNILLPKK